MTAQQRPTDPHDMMGVYRTLDDVPDRRRLRQHAAAYENRDVWAEYLTDDAYERVGHEHGRAVARRVGRYWREHMDERGRHPALATPGDVEAWSAALLDEYAERTVYNYWRFVYLFYEWLRWHTDHPHTYTPVLMAVAECPAAAKIWGIRNAFWRGDDE